MMIVKEVTNSFNKAYFVISEDADDLFSLRRIVEGGDYVIADSTRVIKQVGEYARPDKGERIKVRVSIRVENISFDQSICEDSGNCHTEIILECIILNEIASAVKVNPCPCVINITIQYINITCIESINSRFTASRYFQISKLQVIDISINNDIIFFNHAINR